MEREQDGRVISHDLRVNDLVNSMGDFATATALIGNLWWRTYTQLKNPGVCFHLSHWKKANANCQVLASGLLVFKLYILGLLESEKPYTLRVDTFCIQDEDNGDAELFITSSSRPRDFKEILQEPFSTDWNI